MLIRLECKFVLVTSQNFWTWIYVHLFLIRSVLARVIPVLVQISFLMAHELEVYRVILVSMSRSLPMFDESIISLGLVERAILNVLGKIFIEVYFYLNLPDESHTKNIP